MNLIVTDEATADVTRSSRHYDTKPRQYGAEFEDEVEAAIVRIREMPRLYPLVQDGVPGLEIREYFIARFSQRVIYVMNGDDVLVVAVIHSDSREGAWHKNLPPSLPTETT
jgi:plasmid stabilization system protein ParE